MMNPQLAIENVILTLMSVAYFFKSQTLILSDLIAGYLEAAARQLVMVYNQIFEEPLQIECVPTVPMSLMSVSSILDKALEDLMVALQQVTLPDGLTLNTPITVMNYNILGVLAGVKTLVDHAKTLTMSIGTGLFDGNVPMMSAPTCFCSDIFAFDDEDDDEDDDDDLSNDGDGDEGLGDDPAPKDDGGTLIEDEFFNEVAEEIEELAHADVNA